MSRISIIIPLRQDQGYLKPCIDACFSQEGAEVEVLVLPDVPLPFSDSRIRVEVTGPVSPAKKRNRGAALASGEILAFIDDDTRPLPGWLKAAIGAFQDSSVSAVGGPSITPSDDPWMARVSGAVYESWMMTGAERLRYVPTTARDVNDFPSCNLLVRKTVFEELGGFGTDFWPGEDTEFCLAMTRKGKRIRYVPEAMIDHHRRPSLAGHFRQLSNYGLHRGYFAKRYPETSRKLPYFIPSLAVLVGLVLMILGWMGEPRAFGILGGLSAVYFLLVLVSLLGKSFHLIPPAICGIFASHCIYGISFIRGLLASRLPEEKL